MVFGTVTRDFHTRDAVLRSRISRVIVTLCGEFKQTHCVRQFILFRHIKYKHYVNGYTTNKESRNSGTVLLSAKYVYQNFSKVNPDSTLQMEPRKRNFVQCVAALILIFFPSARGAVCLVNDVRYSCSLRLFCFVNNTGAFFGYISAPASCPFGKFRILGVGIERIRFADRIRGVNIRFELKASTICSPQPIFFLREYFHCFCKHGLPPI